MASERKTEPEDVEPTPVITTTDPRVAGQVGKAIEAIVKATVAKLTQKPGTKEKEVGKDSSQ